MTTLAKGTWFGQRRLVSPSAQNLASATPVDERWVIVGNDGSGPIILTVETSDLQGLSPTFTARTAAGTDPYTGVAWISSPDRTIAVGANGAIDWSTNQGNTWNNLTFGGGQNLFGIVALTGDANSRFVAVGDGVIIAQNSSGVWTARWVGSRLWYSVTHKAGVGWVAVGQGGYAIFSATGVNGTWGPAYIIDPFTLKDVEANDSFYIAVGYGGKAYRSAAGTVGTWSEISIDAGVLLEQIIPLAADDSWLAVDTTGLSWVSNNNGTTWALNEFSIDESVFGGSDDGTNVLLCGAQGSVYVSFEQTQSDPPDPVDPPEVGPAFSANPDMTTQASGRLVGQFRS